MITLLLLPLSLRRTYNVAKPVQRESDHVTAPMYWPSVGRLTGMVVISSSQFATLLYIRIILCTQHKKSVIYV